MSVRGSLPTTLAGRSGAVVQRDGDALGVLHHVVVGHDGAVGVDDEAGAARLDGAHLRLLRDHLVERERQLRRLRLLIVVHRFRVAQLVGDGHDGRLHLLHQMRKVRQRRLRRDRAGRIDRGAGGLGGWGAGLAAHRWSLAADGGRRCGVADGEAAKRGAGQQYGSQCRAAPVARLVCGVGLGCHTILLLGEPIRARACNAGPASGLAPAAPSEHENAQVNVPVVQRLNGFHVNELSVTSRQPGGTVRRPARAELQPVGSLIRRICGNRGEPAMTKTSNGR